MPFVLETRIGGWSRLRVSAGNLIYFYNNTDPFDNPFGRPTSPGYPQRTSEVSPLNGTPTDFSPTPIVNSQLANKSQNADAGRV
ncbi:hypothetical protein JR316_0000141 [Psilocybe cubensis]|uniref:Uncharacterized protein n=1 Tax=Psilocybe cubensis TaxID=181762 RepID=A0ACB8HEE2_PSICU|nr:hypothetical protein JR316_0000141 [Psilocybe cubensis]KAH9486077.1 hypothetical protein JR316_0000141 [Psilocybe cubensis]